MGPGVQPSSLAERRHPEAPPGPGSQWASVRAGDSEFRGEATGESHAKGPKDPDGRADGVPLLVSAFPAGLGADRTLCLAWMGPSGY